MKTVLSALSPLWTLWLIPPAAKFDRFPPITMHRILRFAQPDPMSLYGGFASSETVADRSAGVGSTHQPISSPAREYQAAAGGRPRMTANDDEPAYSGQEIPPNDR